MRIVYGGPDAASMGMTFIDAMDRVCDGGHVRIVSPYLAPERLEQLMARSTRLSVITDFGACFSVLNATARRRLCTIIADRIDAFRHLAGVHAKVVFSQSRVLLGSANLTASGLEDRDELGAIFHEATQLAEARTWFEALWSRGVIPDAVYLEQWLENLPPFMMSALPPFTPHVTARRKTVRSPATKDAVPKPRVRPLDEVLRQSGSAEWVRQYLGAVRWIYEHLTLEADDPRLMLTTPQDGHINLSINNRWVLQHSRDYTHTRIMLPTAQARALAKRLRHPVPWQFGKRGDEIDPPSMAFFPGFAFLSDPEITTPYLRVLRASLLYGKRQPNRHHHRPDLLALALDPRALEAELLRLRMR